MSKLRIALMILLATFGIGTGALANQGKGKQFAEEQPAPTAKAVEKQPRTDRYGDPLPPGALVRLGTIRLRHVSAAVVFSPDGKVLISAGGDGMLRHWDPITGKEKRRLRVQAADSPAFPHLFAADGQSVAGYTPRNIYVWDTNTGKERKHFPIGKVSIPGFDDRLAFVWRLALSADGKKLATHIYDQRNHHCVLLWDVTTGKNLFTLQVKRNSDHLTFSTDGKILGAVNFAEGLRLLDTSTGKEIRKIAGAQNILAFSPNDQTVAAVSRGGGVKVWNAADGKEVFHLPPVAGRWPGSLAFAPDNKTLAVSSQEGAVLYDIASGKKIRTLGVNRYGKVVFSPSGKTAATRCGSAIHVWDVATGKEIGARPGHDSSVGFLTVTPDGSSIATFAVGDGLVRLWDTETGKPQMQVSADHSVRSGAFSPDGRFLVTGGGDPIVRMWDSKTGKEIRKFTIESTDPMRENWQVMEVALSSDGERLAAIAEAGNGISTFRIDIWNLATGAKRSRRSQTYLGFESRFSPDARSIAHQRDGMVVIEDAATGQEIGKVEGRGPLVYSPDGQILALAHFRTKSLPPGTAGPAGGRAGEIDAICLVELATGKQLLRIETGVVGHNLLAYSPDGRTVATANQDGFRIWDVATGRELFRRQLPEEYRGSFNWSYISSLAFLPSGDRLATGLMDSTALIWDLQPKSWHAGIAVKKTDDVDLSNLWSDLAGDDAAKAHRAVWTLVEVSEKAVPFLKDHLHPAATLDAKQVQSLIADLDSPEFAVREQARKKLASFGEFAEPALRKALADKPSLEARRRLEALLADAEKAGRGLVRSPELLRTLRAIRALEHIDDRQARQLLYTLAGGAPGARQTRLAKEALHRLHQRAGSSAKPSSDPR